MITSKEADEIVEAHFGGFMKKLTMNGFEVCHECGGTGSHSRAGRFAGDKETSDPCHTCRPGGPDWTEAEIDQRFREQEEYEYGKS